MTACKDIVLISMLSSILIISKEILAFLPNIELVTFLIIIYTLIWGVRKTVFISVIFTLLQIVLYGFGLWILLYFLAWPFLSLLTNYFKKWLKDEFSLSLFSGLFGLIFGVFSAIPYFVIDLNLGISYYIKGIPFDIIHCIGNYVVMMILFKPVYRNTKGLAEKYKFK